MAYIKWMEGCSKTLKIILCIPFVHLTWLVYRVLKAIFVKHEGQVDVAQIIIAAVMTLLGFVSWLADLIMMAVNEELFLQDVH